MEEGYSTNKPPLFKDIKYNYQKEGMIAHFKSIHIELQDIIEHGYYIPLDYQLNEVPITSWTDTQRQRFLLNSKSQNVLCALSKEEYVKVHSYKSEKQMWDTFALMYEGLSQEKCNKIILLTRKYELFTMDDGEDIQAMFGCFQTILNELRCLKKTFDNYDNIEKTLRSLSRKWRSLVTILRIVKNLDSMSIVELIGTLKVHEQELQQDERFKGFKRLPTQRD